MYLKAMVVCLALISFSARAQFTVWTYHDNNQRTGLNTNEMILNPTNVSSSTFGKLFTYPVDGYVYAQPLYVPNVNIQGQGTHDVVYVETEHNTVYAFDADSAGASGGLLWETNLGPSAATTTVTYTNINNVVFVGFTNKNFGTKYNGGAYTDIQPEVGITGTPVIDTNAGVLYLDSFTGVVGVGVTNYYHKIHALDITSGEDEPYSPVLVAASVTGFGVDSVSGVVTFNPRQQLERSALTLAGGILYVCYAGYADTDPYHGWILGFNPTNLTQLTNYVFNTTPNATAALFGDDAGEGGIWMAGDGPAVDTNLNLYVSLANGSFSATNGTTSVDFGDSVLKLATTNGLSLVDYFTPFGQLSMQADDSDLGSGGVMLLPDQPGGTPHQLVCADKAGEAFEINRDQFTTGNDHFNSTGSVDYAFFPSYPFANGAGSFDTPAYFNGTIYYGPSSDVLRAIPMSSGQMQSYNQSSSGVRSYAFPGATPTITANGINGGIVWTLQYSKTNNQVLVANNAANLALEIYNSSQVSARDQLGSGIKFAVPTVADGRVFVGSSNSVSVFGLLGGNLSFATTAFSVAKANTNATITVSRLGGTNGATEVYYSTVAGGTAVAGVNYTSVAGVLNWAAGDATPKTFTVPVIDDALVDPNETVDLILSSTNGSAAGPQTAAALTIVSPPLDLWKIKYFGVNANNLVMAGNTADPAGDGIVNLLKYAYALNPTVAEVNPFTGRLNGKAYQLDFPRNISATDLTYLVQVSANLAVWSNMLTFTAGGWITNIPGATVTESATNGVVPNQYVNVTATTATNVTTKTSQYLRLQVH